MVLAGVGSRCSCLTISSDCILALERGCWKSKTYTRIYEDSRQAIYEVLI
jgi:hypothetical protein